MAKERLHGLFVPVVTPFNADYSPNRERFLAQCRWLLDQGANGLAPFGTTSEANSLSIEERMELLEFAIDAGIPAGRLMPGTGTCSIIDSQKLTSHAVSLNCGGVLMLPPFYYKNMSDEGLYASFSEVIQRVGDPRLNIYLYHIPQLTGIPITAPLIERLVKAYPDTVVGLKDSGGDWENTEAILRGFRGFSVFPGSEAFLLQGLRAGGVGCITATGNVNPAGIRKVVDNWQTDEADALQARITEVRKVVQAYPLVPAVKRMIAHFHKAPGWEQVRPPMVVLDESRTAKLMKELEAVAFEVARLG